MIAASPVFALLLALAAPTSPPPAAPDDPIARHVFPPELVMRHSQAIQLAADQREAIKAAIQKAQSTFLDLQWDVQGQSGKLVELLQQQPVDESAVLAQVDRVLDLERRIKKTQLSLLIRIKNTLTAEQQQRLQELR